MNSRKKTPSSKHKLWNSIMNTLGKIIMTEVMDVFNSLEWSCWFLRSRLQSNSKAYLGRWISSFWVVLGWQSYHRFWPPFSLVKHRNFSFVGEACFYKRNWIQNMRTSNGKGVFQGGEPVSHFGGHHSLIKGIQWMKIRCLQSLSFVSSASTLLSFSSRAKAR